MRAFLPSLLMLVSCVCFAASDISELKEDDVVSNNQILFGKNIVPLPAGEWTVAYAKSSQMKIDLGESDVRNNGPFHDVYLARTDKNKLTGMVNIYGAPRLYNSVDASGFSDCDRDTKHYAVAQYGTTSAFPKCSYIDLSSGVMRDGTKLGKIWSDVQATNDNAPASFVVLAYRKAERQSKFAIDFYFAPEQLGFSKEDSWDPDHLSDKQKAYLTKANVWLNEVVQRLKDNLNGDAKNLALPEFPTAL